MECLGYPPEVVSDQDDTIETLRKILTEFLTEDIHVIG